MKIFNLYNQYVKKFFLVFFMNNFDDNLFRGEIGKAAISVDFSQPFVYNSDSPHNGGCHVCLMLLASTQTDPIPERPRKGAKQMLQIIFPLRWDSIDPQALLWDKLFCRFSKDFVPTATANLFALAV